MESSKKEIILVVDDEDDIIELVRFNLEDAGYTVIAVTSGEDAVEKALAVTPNLIVLDLMLPGMSGLEVCRHLKSYQKTREIPIIMLTARGDEKDIVKGLDSGADDYVTKPFSPKILNARVNAILRRGAERDAAPASIEGLTIDRSRHLVFLNDAQIDFTNTEFSMLEALISRRGAVMTRQQIVAAIRGGEITVTERSVDVHMASIRKKLGEPGKKILTVRGVGYRLDV